MGYKSVVMQDVKVTVNQATETDFKLQPAVIQGEELSVTPELTEPPPPEVPQLNTAETTPAPPNAGHLVSEEESSPPDPEIFVAYDEPPRPVGGFRAIQEKLVYPEIAQKAGVEGRVYVNVLINAKGKVVDTKILKSLGNNGCDESAIRAIKQVTWEPATQRGKPVAVWVGIPITFQLGK